MRDSAPDYPDRNGDCVFAGVLFLAASTANANVDLSSAGNLDTQANGDGNPCNSFANT